MNNRIALRLFSILFLVVAKSALWADDSNVDSSFAVVIDAEYSARFAGNDLVDGVFDWTIERQGKSEVELDLSGINVAMSELRASDGPVIWGTTEASTQVAVVDDANESWSGRWSAHGLERLDTTKIKCELVHAMQTQLTLEVPVGLTVTSSKGFVSLVEQGPEVNFWRIELGRDHIFELKIAPERAVTSPTALLAAVQLIHAVHRDGVFFQSDLTFGQVQEEFKSVQFYFPFEATIRSVTASGASLDFRRNEITGIVDVVVPEVMIGRRLNLRLQGEVPIQFGQLFSLPQLAPINFTESSLDTTIRIDSQLDVDDVLTDGYFQTAFSIEDGSELWKLRATKPESKIEIRISEPRNLQEIDVETVINYRESMPWCLSRLTLSSQSNQVNQLVLKVPTQWQIISVDAENEASSVAAWVVKDHVLSIDFQEPNSQNFARRLSIVARCQRLGVGSYEQLPSLTTASGETNLRQVDWILPDHLDVELIDHPNWVQQRMKVSYPGARSDLLSSEVLVDQEVVRFGNQSGRGKAHQPFQIIAFDQEDVVDDNFWIEPVTEVVSASKESFSAISVAALWLRTEVNGERSGGRMQLVHHAVFRLNVPMQSSELELALREECRLVAVSVDGQAVRPFRMRDRIRLPADVGDLSEFEVVYITELERQLFGQQTTVSIPQTNLRVHGFEYEMALPRTQTLSLLELAGTEVSTVKRRYFFGPLSLMDSSVRNQLVLEPKTEEETRRSAVQLSQWNLRTPRSGETLTFATWDSQFVKNISLTVFFLCILIGLALRKFNLFSWVRSKSPWIVPIWIVSLFFVQCFSWNALSLVVGGMLSGSLVSILVPIHLSPFVANLKMVIFSRISRWLVLAPTLFFAINVYAQEVEIKEASDSQAVDPSESMLDSKTRSLIRTADYTVLQEYPVRLIEAQLTVLVFSDDDEVLVPISLKNVSFIEGADCRVDGKRVLLIPQISGEGVAVRIDRAKIFDKDKTSWTQHELVFRFSPSPSIEPGATGGLPTIPRVHDSSLKLLGRSHLGSIERDGQIEEYVGESVAMQLGGVATLDFESDPQPEIQSEAHTLLSVSPLGIEGKTHLAELESAWEGPLYLRVPDQGIVERISGDRVVSWFHALDSTGSPAIVVELSKHPSTNSSVLIEFHIPNQNALTATIPEIDWCSGVTRHLVGFDSPLAVELQFIDQGDSTVRLPTDFSEKNVFPRERPDRVLEVHSPSEIEIEIESRKSRVEASSSTVLTLQNDQMTWKMSLALDVQELPVFHHQIKLADGVRVTKVLDGDQADEVPIEFRQSGQIVTIFYPEGHLGMRSAILSGDQPMTPNLWQPVLFGEVEGADTLGVSQTLLDETNWKLELQTRNGDPQMAEPSSNFDPLFPRVFINTDQDEVSDWTHIRVTPPQSQLNVDSIVRFRRGVQQAGKNIEPKLHHVFRIEPELASLTRVRLRIPTELGQFQVRPASRQTVIRRDRMFTDLDVEIIESDASATILSVVTDLPKEMTELITENQLNAEPTSLPTILINSQIAKTTTLLIPAKVPLDVTPSSGFVIEPEDFPEWMNPNWRMSVVKGAFMAYGNLEKTLEVRRKSSSLLDAQPTIQFAETLLWAQESDRQVEGSSQLWIQRNNAHQASFTFPDSVVIQDVFVVTTPSTFSKASANEVVVEFLTNEPIVVVRIQWTTPIRETGRFVIPTRSSLGDAPHLVSSCSTGSIRSIENASQPTTQALLIRWNLLLGLAEQVKSVIPVESLLMSNLRQCSETAQRWMTENRLSVEQLESVENARSRWDGLVESIVISADSERSTDDFSGVSIHSMLYSDDRSIDCDWFLIDDETTLQFESNLAWHEGVLKIAGAILMAVGIIGLVFWRQEDLRTAIRVLETSPEVGLFFLSIFWICLFPLKVIGFAMLLLAGIVTILSWNGWDRSANAD